MDGIYIFLIVLGTFALYFRAKSRIRDLENELRGAEILLAKYEDHFGRDQTNKILDEIERNINN